MNVYPFTDEEYGKILDSIVVTCVDVLVTYKGKLLLIRRSCEPIKSNWWFFGGRMLKGEDLPSAAKRGLLRELNLDIDDTERFTEVGVFNLIWPSRREPDPQNGCHHLLVAHQIELNVNEKKIIDNLLESDDNYQWIDIHLSSNNEDLIPELRAIIQRLPHNSNHKLFFGVHRFQLR